MGRAVSGSTIRSHGAVRRSIDACIALAEDARVCKACAPSVSEWSVANHLEHLLLADRWMFGWIESVVGAEASDESADPSGSPSPLGYVVLSTGFIPRGRGRAPDRTCPSDLAVSEILAGFRELRAQVEALEPRLGEVDALALTREHPVLGRFTPARWLRFAHVHHAHHEKIVRDILSAEAD